MGLAKRLLLVVLAAAACLPAVAADATLAAARFAITLDGHELASFTELKGLTSAAAATGMPRSVSVVLSRPMTRNVEMAAWHELVILGDVAAARKSISITAYNSAGQPVARYHLTDAWPQKVEVGTLRAGNSEVLMETITMTCEFIQRVAI